ncbi:MAG: hypothetical protein L6V88_04390 [Anaerotruncus sp.]|nr:MAG: hypothetical protein L6V88_04390 [Anaerotruncus sp.]
MAKRLRLPLKQVQTASFFGSVTGKDISAAIKQQLGIEVDKRKNRRCRY